MCLHCQDLRTIFSKHGPHAWLIRYIHSVLPQSTRLVQYILKSRSPQISQQAHQSGNRTLFLSCCSKKLFVADCFFVILKQWEASTMSR